MPAGNHVFYNAKVTVNGVDLSEDVRAIGGFPLTLAKVDSSGMGHLQNRAIPGVQDVGDISLSFKQNYTAAKVPATLMPLWTNRTIVSLVVRPDQDEAVGVENPQFTVDVFLSAYDPIAGSRGDLHMAPTTFAVAGALAVATA